MHSTMQYNSPWLHTVVGMLNTSGGLVQIILPTSDPASTSTIFEEVKDSLCLAIKPSPQPYLHCTMSPSEVPPSIWVDIRSGIDRPYFVAELGVHNGSFIMYNGEALPLPREQLVEMLKAKDGSSFEDWRADQQAITLNGIKARSHQKGLPFGRPQLLTLGLVGRHGLYTNLAYMVSDQCQCKMRFIWISGSGRIGKILDQQTVEATLPELSSAFSQTIHRYNARRAELHPAACSLAEDFPTQAMVDLAHIVIMLMDFSQPASLRCCLYDNRLELWAYGGPPDNAGSVSLYAGEPAYRNQKLAKLIERFNPGTVSHLCFSQYEPVFHRLPHLFRMEYDDIGFRITLPNFNLPEEIKPPTEYVQRSTRLLELLKDNVSLTKTEAAQQMGLSLNQTTPLLKRMLAEGLIKLHDDSYCADDTIYYPIDFSFTAPLQLPCIPMPHIP